MQNQEYEIDLMELTIYFCHRWKKILLCAVAGLAIGFAIGARTAAVSYTATARFVVSVLDGKFFFHLQICKVELCRGCRQPFGGKPDGGFIVG